MKRGFFPFFALISIFLPLEAMQQSQAQNQEIIPEMVLKASQTDLPQFEHYLKQGFPLVERFYEVIDKELNKYQQVVNRIRKANLLEKLCGDCNISALELALNNSQQVPLEVKQRMYQFIPAHDEALLIRADKISAVCRILAKNYIKWPLVTWGVVPFIHQADRFKLDEERARIMDAVLENLDAAQIKELGCGNCHLIACLEKGYFETARVILFHNYLKRVPLQNR